MSLFTVTELMAWSRHEVSEFSRYYNTGP